MRPGRPGSSTRIPKAERRIAGAQLYGLAFTIKIIKMGGHRIKGHFDSVVQPVDMFPWTGHIEEVPKNHLVALYTMCVIVIAGQRISRFKDIVYLQKTHTDKYHVDVG